MKSIKSRAGLGGAIMDEDLEMRARKSVWVGDQRESVCNSEGRRLEQRSIGEEVRKRRRVRCERL